MVAFNTKNDNLWLPFWHPFSDLFRKSKKCKKAKSITPNVVLSHQKPSIFASIFHAIFMFFPNPLPEGIFRGSKCPSILKSPLRAGGPPPRRGRVWIGRLSWEFPSCSFPFLLGFLLDVLLVGDHLASKIGTRGRRKLIQKIHTFFNLVF